MKTYQPPDATEAKQFLSKIWERIEHNRKGCHKVTRRTGGLLYIESQAKQKSSYGFALTTKMHMIWPRKAV